MQQIVSMTQQEAPQMQFMLDIRRSMSKAYADLVANFNSSLTNLVLTIRDVYPFEKPTFSPDLRG